MEKQPNKFHALQLFTDTFSAETVHLTNEAVGIYIRLLSFAWTKNAKMFTNHHAYRICQCIDNKCKKKVDQILVEFFIRNGESENTTYWLHKRLVQEHQYLSDKYKSRSEAGRKGGLAKSDNASSKIVPPSPTPIPIPNKNIQSSFEQFWDTLKIKKGSKHLASKRFKVHCPNLDPVELAEKFNRYASSVKDIEFLAHVSTWINQRRFEDEENNKTIEIKQPDVFYNGIKLKLLGHYGDQIEYTDNNGNKYQKHKWNGKPIEKVT